MFDAIVHCHQYVKRCRGLLEEVAVSLAFPTQPRNRRHLKVGIKIPYQSLVQVFVKQYAHDGFLLLSSKRILKK